jgi:hypothetical protein
MAARQGGTAADLWSRGGALTKVLSGALKNCRHSCKEYNYFHISA